MPEPSTCSTCGGDGYIGDTFCETCYGTGVYPIKHVNTLQLIKIVEKINDINDKVNDVEEKVDEIKGVVDEIKDLVD